MCIRNRGDGLRYVRYGRIFTFERNINHPAEKCCCARVNEQLWRVVNGITDAQHTQQLHFFWCYYAAIAAAAAADTVVDAGSS